MDNNNVFISKLIKDTMKKDENYLSDKISYIKRNLQKGYKKDSLKWALINQGNTRQEVDKAFIQAEKELSQEESLRRERLASMQPPPQIEPLLPEEDKPKRGFFSRFFGSS